MDKPPWKQVRRLARHECPQLCVQVISPVPQIDQFKIDSSWEFLLVATDGVRLTVHLILLC